MVGVFMIPINDLQSKIYQALNTLNINVYDEVQQEATMPLVNIGDYTINSLEFKGQGFTFNWTINIYTEYEGKKQVNELVSKVIECMYKLIGLDLNDIYSVNDVMINEANVMRNEGYYIANLNMKIDIM